MDVDYNGLCSVCSAIFSSEFEEIDKLKSMLQVAFEFLHADSITAYRYDRVTQRLELIAMPGVLQREVMRGPTPEPIFQWERERLNASQLPEPIWIENETEYEIKYNKRRLTALSESKGAHVQKSSTPDFRERQLSKYPEGTDLSMAKFCLYKGIGQTEDHVGMIFFNFPKFKKSKKPTFNVHLKQAVIYISTLVREILIQELYHTEKHTIAAGTLLRDSLNLLRMAEEHALGLTPIFDYEKSVSLPEEYHAVANTRMRDLQARVEKSDKTAPYWALLQKRLQILEDLLAGKAPIDRMLESTIITTETQLLQMCGHVCRAALGTCETFGGQADIIFVLGENIGRRIEPQDVGGSRRNEYFWLDSNSITSYCLDTGKVFALNNIREKAHQDFRMRFENEYAAQQYQSLIVVPIFDIGPYKCALRLMSSDRNCFLDHHTQAVQFTAFVAKHSLNMLMQALMRRQVAQGLAFFAQGQAIGPQASTEDLLCEALKVLGADYAVFWFVPEKPKELPFEGAVWVPASSEVKSRTFWVDSSPDIVRPHGMTHGIYQYAKTHKKADALFCVHILKDICRENKNFPDYSFEVDASSSSDNSSGDDLDKRGSFSKSHQSNFPGIDQPVTLSPKAGEHPHTQVGIAVAQHGSPSVISGVMWIGFDGLRDLNWWERAYLRGLSNYIAQGQAASGLILTLRSFNHSIEHLATVGNPSIQKAKSSSEGQKSIETVLMDIERSRTGWEIIDAKAREVRRMLSWSQPQKGGRWTVRLKEFSTRNALRHAWSLATDLNILPHEFKEITRRKLKLDQCRDMTIAYCPGVRPDDDCVSGAVYTAATVILENARIHGKPPYLAWVVEISPQIRIIFGNGGLPPSENKLRVPEAQMKFADSKRGVGLWFARRLLHTEGGSIALRGKPERNEFGYIPDIAHQCETFYEVIVKEGE